MMEAEGRELTETRRLRVQAFVISILGRFRGSTRHSRLQILEVLHPPR